MTAQTYWTHDCKHCRHVTSYVSQTGKQIDLYSCHSQLPEESKSDMSDLNTASLIYRYGEAENYWSMRGHLPDEPELLPPVVEHRPFLDRIKVFTRFEDCEAYIAEHNSSLTRNSAYEYEMQPEYRAPDEVNILIRSTSSGKKVAYVTERVYFD